MGKREPRDVDCEHTCPAKWVDDCVRSAGHAGPHRDWTDRPWTDKDLAKAEERAKAREPASNDKGRAL